MTDSRVSMENDRSIHVLLIEDNEDYARLMKDVLLEYPRFQLTHTGSLKSAVRILTESSFDLILLDLNLPDSRGLESFERLHECFTKTPILILTGLNDEALALVAVSKGAQDYVVKGLVDPPWIVRMMRYAIERKRAEEMITQEQSFLHSLMDSITDAIYFKDEKSRFIHISKNQAKIFGLKNSMEAVGKTDFDFFSREHAEKAFKDEQKIIETGQPLIGIEEKETWPDGRVTWVSTTKMPLRSKAGKVIGTFGISRDITEGKLATEQLKKTISDLAISEKALRYAMDELKQSHQELQNTQMQLIQTEKLQSVGVLAAGVAHEVKNPLAIILLGAEYLAGKVPASDKNMVQTVKDIQEAVKRADSIVRGLVDFSASRELSLKAENLNDVIEDSLKLIKHEITKSHITVKKAYSSSIPKCMLDRTRAEQVFINLLLNSIHAMSAGGNISLMTYLSTLDSAEANLGDRTGMRLRAKDEVVVAEIEDNGSGISKDKLTKIFDPFFTTKATGEGAGLGLSVAQRIVELHGGKIDVRNRKEGGVRVTVMFKAHQNE